MIEINKTGSLESSDTSGVIKLLFQVTNTTPPPLTSMFSYRETRYCFLSPASQNALLSTHSTLFIKNCMSVLPACIDVQKRM